MTYNTHQWQQRIRAEYDMSAKEVIKLFARDRYSKRLTAATLEIGLSLLTRYAKQEGIVFYGKNELRPECKGHGYGYPKGRKREKPSNPNGYNQYIHRALS
jgi:hypothetical protein